MGPDVPPRPLTRRSTAADFLEATLIAVVLALFVRTFLFQAFVVPSPSMENTLLAGDHVVVNKFVFGPRSASALDRLLPRRAVRRGDVIVFKFPEDPRRDFVKRVAALPGDSLEIRDKMLFVNNRRDEQPRASHTDARLWPDDSDLPESLRRRDQVPALRLPPDCFFALGDNRDNSYDSRFWGPVPAGNVKGRPLLIYWSHPSDVAGSRQPLRWIREFFSETRWSRTFLPVR
jgi:signal peptidase I